MAQIVTIDFESYFDSKFNLRTLSTPEYVRSADFHLHGAAVKIGGEPAQWVSGDSLKAGLEKLNWRSIDLISHNSYFDGMVLAHHYGHVPRRYIDTLSACRALLPTGVDRDLDSAAEFFGLGGKVQGVLNKTKGVKQLSEELEAELGHYAIVDAEKAYELYKTLWHYIPEDERALIDLTIRMGVTPLLELDQDLLMQVIEDEKNTRRALIKASGVAQSVLSSNKQFAEWVVQQGLEPPMKLNPKGEPTYAFGKTDAEWVEFKLNNPDKLAVWSAREATKSTINISRAERYLNIARLAPGTLPMAYGYYGAGPGRWSGIDKLNCQNLPRLDKSQLRRALRAPKGHRVVVVDESQIELRTNLWFCGQVDILHKLATGIDIYVETASKFFGIPEAEVGKPQRFMGKVIELMSQYQSGGPKFRSFCAGGPYGNDPIMLSEEEANNAIRTYRTNRPKVVAQWKFNQEMLKGMAYDPNFELDQKCVGFRHQYIELPSGLGVDYSGLRINDEGQFIYGINGATKTTHGGKVLQNIISGIARCIFASHALEIMRCGIRLVGFTHDELLAVVPEQEADDALATMIEIMSTTPSFTPGLPLGAEGDHDETYCK